MDNRKNAAKLENILQLKNQPVAIKLLKENKEMPGYDDGRTYTFCQYIMKAKKGINYWPMEIIYPVPMGYRPWAFARFRKNS